jgi:hypothetical protein
MINIKEETKGHGEVVWGNKFSTVAGSTTSVTVGAKHTIEVAANNSLRFGMKNAFEFGPSFVYHCAPEFQKASKFADATASSFGRAQSSGFGQTMNWLNAKITFSDIKEHKFFIAKEGSTSMFTTNKQYSETGFTAGAGYGKIATAGYDAYCSAVKKTKWVMTGMTAIPVLVSLLQNLASGPGSSPDPGGKAVPQPWLKLNSNIGVAINIGATIGPAIGSLWAAFHAVAQREGFKNAIKPLTVIDMNKSKGLFMGSDHSQLTPVGLANGLKMSELGIMLGVSQSTVASAFDKDGDLKFGKLNSDPNGMLAIGHLHGSVPTSATTYVVNQAPVFAVFASEGHGHESAEKSLKLLKVKKGDMLMVGQDCRLTADKITLTDIDPSQSETAITLKGGHNKTKKSIELKIKEDQSISLTDKAMTVKTGKQTKLVMQDTYFNVSLGNCIVNLRKDAIVLKASAKSKLVMTSSATSIMGGNLKVMS